MPRRAAMDSAEQERFRTRLTDEAVKIRTALAVSDPADESITPDSAIGRLTRMEALQAQAMGAAMKQRQQKRLQQIDRALARIDEGLYGTCVRCGGEIPTGRLEVMPETRLCIRCAARR